MNRIEIARRISDECGLLVPHAKQSLTACWM